jgi:hypothetical protein
MDDVRQFAPTGLRRLHFSPRRAQKIIQRCRRRIKRLQLLCACIRLLSHEAEHISQGSVHDVQRDLTAYLLVHRDRFPRLPFNLPNHISNIRIARIQRNDF